MPAALTRLARHVPAAVTICLATACGEAVAPPRSATVPLAFAIAPSPGTAQAVFGGSVDAIRVFVARQNEETAVDTTIAFPARREELRVAVNVPLVQKVETLYVYVDLLAGQASLWYASHELILREGIVPAIPPLALSYIGPGYDAVLVTIQGRGFFVSPGGTLQLSAVAQNQFQAVVPTPIAWSVSDTRLATITTTGGLLTARATPGTLWVRAYTPTGLVDSVQVSIAIPQVR